MYRLAILFSAIGVIAAVLGYTMTAKLVIILGLLLLIASLVLTVWTTVTKGKRDPAPEIDEAVVVSPPVERQVEKKL